MQLVTHQGYVQGVSTLAMKKKIGIKIENKKRYVIKLCSNGFLSISYSKEKKKKFIYFEFLSKNYLERGHFRKWTPTFKICVF